MNISTIQTSLVKFLIYTVLLTLTLFISCLIANSQTKELQPKQNQQEHNANQTVESNNPRPTVILVPDVSISVQNWIKEMRNVLQQIIIAAPENSIIGIVTVGTQSDKRVFPNRMDAESYIKEIKANSGFTDLERGTDAALAVLQETKATKPTLVVYLTDGEVSLPKEMKKRVDFKTILSREFTPRPEVRVLVLNIASKPMETVGLPSNVTVVPISNWTEAEKQMKETLATQIQIELKSEPSSETTAEKENASPEKNNTNRSTLLWSIPTFVIALIGGWLIIRRYRHKTVDSAEHIADERIDILRPEDLQCQSNVSADNMVALVELYDGKISRSEQLFNGERRVIGKSTTADIKFDSLKQENSLELRFDDNQLTAYRLHPQTYYEMDEVQLNQLKVPINQTTFYLGNSDVLKIGNVQITAKIVGSSVASILMERDSRFETQSFSSRLKNKPALPLNNRLNERKSRWN